MGSPVTHWEIMGEDGDGLGDFYAGVFGWNLAAVPGLDSDFTVSGDEAGGSGGAVGKGMEDMVSYLTMYFDVDSIDDQLAQIEAAGGRTIVPSTVIPDTVTFAMFADPAGNLLGLTENE